MVVVILLIILGVFWLSFHFVRPMPPRKLTMTTGMEGGSYAVLGERYRQVLARNGIQLQLLPSSGSVENLMRLMDESKSVDVGLPSTVIGTFKHLFCSKLLKPFTPSLDFGRSS
jgi:TRAP-type uncharacterized transport system substrate-binding protein